jgi:tRNA threonylcarbamoyl adenosine modification protein (Sua5/YciO/YrdC/YwlC family)
MPTAPLDRAVAALARGALVVYPTDTLYGLAASAAHRSGVERLYAVKGRPTDQPVSIALSSLEEIEALTVLTPPLRAFLRRELPGALTVVLPGSPVARRRLSPRLFGPAGQLAVRLPDHPLARELARRAGPITSTSANRHGTPPAPELSGARAALGAEVAVYLDGAPSPSGTASRVIDLTGPMPAMLRP